MINYFSKKSITSIPLTSSLLGLMLIFTLASLVQASDSERESDGVAQFLGAPDPSQAYLNPKPPLTSSTLAFDTAWFNFDKDLEGWDFYNHPDSLWENYDCMPNERSIPAPKPCNIFWEDAGYMGVNTTFYGWWYAECDYSFRMKSVVAPVSTEWDGVGSIQARIYNSSSSVIYARLGYSTPSFPGNNYNRSEYTSLPIGEWITLMITEAAPGDFADLDAVAILFGSYETGGTYYVDWVSGIKIAPDVTPTLVYPPEGKKIEENLPTFSWNETDGDYYTIQVSSDSLFNNILLNETTVTKTEYTDPTPLPFSDYDYLPGGGGDHDPYYYWRVMGHYNSGGGSNVSATGTFIITGPHEVPSEYPTISSARGAFPYYIGGTVLVAPGTYTGPGNCNVSMGGEGGVNIIASDGPEVTILDCEYKYAGFQWDAYSSGGTVSGFTIKNASGGGDFPGVFLMWTGSGTIRDCIIEGAQGPAIRAFRGGGATVENTIIRDCYAGVIVSSSGRISLHSSQIYNNAGWGIDANDWDGGAAGSILVDSCLFYNNPQGDIYIQGVTTVDISNTTIIPSARGLWFAGGEDISTVRNTIIAFSKSEYKDAGFVWSNPSNTVDVQCTNVFGNVGGDWMDRAASLLGMNGNISADPEFCDTTNLDYTISSTSPCIGEAYECGLIGAFGVGCAGNLPPILDSIGPKTVNVGETLTFTVRASDPDGAPPYLSISDDLPSEIKFIDNNDGTGTFSWSPLSNQFGTYEILFEATERVYNANEPKIASELVLIEVTNELRCDFAHETGTIIDTIIAFTIDTIIEYDMVIIDTISVDTTIDSWKLGKLQVKFSSIINGGQPPYIYYDWFLGEGEGKVLVSNEPSFIHTFSDTGTYTVSLQIVDSYEDFCSHSKNIHVSPGPMLVLSTSGLNFSNDLDVQDFTIYNTGNNPLIWNIQSLPEWAAVDLSSGVTPEKNNTKVEVTINRDHPDLLMEGNYQKDLLVSSNADNKPLTLSLYTDLRPLLEDSSGFLINDEIRVPFNGIIASEALFDAMQIFTSDSVDMRLTQEFLNGYPISVLYISPADGEEFEELSSITLDFSNLIKTGSNTESYMGAFLSGAAIWPGDANHDGIVDERDILPIGLYYNATGPEREMVSSNWERYLVSVLDSVQRWQPLRAVYADADGNGQVEAIDICAIADNWQKSAITSNQDTSPALKEAILNKEMNLSTLSNLYEVLIDCDESLGRTILLDQLGGLLSDQELPDDYTLKQNYPNPFNPSTQIEFFLPTAGPVSIQVYNVIGQLVTTLINDYRESGYHTVSWQATDDNGLKVSSGIYLYRLKTQGTNITKSMVLLR